MPAHGVENNAVTQTHNISLVVLAGGLGSRFGGAKQIAELPQLGRTIMELSIADAFSAGVRHCVIVANELVNSELRERVLPRLPRDLDVDIVMQRTDDVPKQYQHLSQEREKPWGTGHALLCAKSCVRDKAIVITADDFYGAKAYQQVMAHWQRSNNWACVAYPLALTLSDQGSVNRGICRVENNLLKEVREVTGIEQQSQQFIGYFEGERLNLELGALASMTFWAVDTRLFSILEENFMHFLHEYDNGVRSEYYLPNQIQYGIDHHHIDVNVYQAQQKWFGMTYKNELAVLGQQILHQQSH